MSWGDTSTNSEQAMASLSFKVLVDQAGVKASKILNELQIPAFYCLQIPRHISAKNTDLILTKSRTIFNRYLLSHNIAHKKAL